METTNHSAAPNFDALPLSSEFVAQLVAEGRTSALFQYSMEVIRTYNDFDPDWTVDECEERRRDVIETVKRQIGEAIKAKHRHCGQPLTVRGAYDFETQRHSLLVRCECCGKAVAIEENAEHVH